MKCSRCGKNEAIRFNGKRYFCVLDYNWVKGKRYFKQIYFCKECSDKFKTWLEEEGYAKRDIPLMRTMVLTQIIEQLMNESRDLGAQVESLSNILAEKDHRIMDLEAEVEMLRENNRESVSRCVDFFNINDFDTTYYCRDDEDIPKLDIRHEADEVNKLICAMTLAGASNEEIRNIVMYSMVVIDCKKLKLDWQKAKADFHVQELKDRYFPFYQHEKHTV